MGDSMEVRTWAEWEFTEAWMKFLEGLRLAFPFISWDPEYDADMLLVYITGRARITHPNGTVSKDICIRVEVRPWWVEECVDRDGIVNAIANALVNAILIEES